MPSPPCPLQSLWSLLCHARAHESAKSFASEGRLLSVCAGVQAWVFDKARPCEIVNSNKAPVLLPFLLVVPLSLWGRVPGLLLCPSTLIPQGSSRCLDVDIPWIYHFQLDSLKLQNHVSNQQPTGRPHTDSTRQLTLSMARTKLLRATLPAASPSPTLHLRWYQLHPSWGSGLPGPWRTP